MLDVLGVLGIQMLDLRIDFIGEARVADAGAARGCWGGGGRAGSSSLLVAVDARHGCFFAPWPFERCSNDCCWQTNYDQVRD